MNRKKENIKILIGNKTDVGILRKHKPNQDYFEFFDSEYGKVFIVCDGMGGHAGGEVASRLSVSVMRTVIQNSKKITSTTEIIKQAIKQAHEAIIQKSKEEPALTGMGTTCVLTIIDIEKKSAYYAHVGDSRIYLVRNKKIRLLTKDHSWVQEELVDKRLISPEEAEHHDNKNVITRALGSKNAEPVINSMKLESDDQFILCTDGLSNVVKKNEILDTMIKLNPSEASDKLIDMALKAGGPDNITVQIIKIHYKKILPKIPPGTKYFVTTIFTIAALLSIIYFFNKIFQKPENKEDSIKGFLTNLFKGNELPVNYKLDENIYLHPKFILTDNKSETISEKELFDYIRKNNLKCSDGFKLKTSDTNSKACTCIFSINNNKWYNYEYNLLFRLTKDSIILNSINFVKIIPKIDEINILMKRFIFSLLKGKELKSSKNSAFPEYIKFDSVDYYPCKGKRINIDKKNIIDRVVEYDIRIYEKDENNIKDVNIIDTSNLNFSTSYGVALKINYELIYTDATIYYTIEANKIKISKIKYNPECVVDPNVFKSKFKNVNSRGKNINEKVQDDKPSIKKDTQTKAINAESKNEIDKNDSKIEK